MSSAMPFCIVCIDDADSICGKLRTDIVLFRHLNIAPTR
jgi:hypothetical protein